MRFRAGRVELCPELADVRQVRIVVVLRDVVALELDVPDAVHVDVVLRQVEDVERALRRRLLPRQLDDAAVVQGHDLDPRQFLSRHVGRTATSASAAASAASTLAPLRRRLCRRLCKSRRAHAGGRRGRGQEIPSIHGRAPHLYASWFVTFARMMA